MVGSWYKHGQFNWKWLHHVLSRYSYEYGDVGIWMCLWSQNEFSLLLRCPDNAKVPSEASTVAAQFAAEVAEDELQVMMRDFV